VHVGPL